ncbi:hypothetical protein GCM10009690_03950 [Brevibacterium permense]|uniref:Uncharacterized protein n=1 Tax=Brevibacterium permense TaxID=234834 RepID=A0ABN1ZTV0_9MICO
MLSAESRSGMDETEQLRIRRSQERECVGFSGRIPGAIQRDSASRSGFTCWSRFKVVIDWSFVSVRLDMVRVGPSQIS